MNGCGGNRGSDGLGRPDAAGEIRYDQKHGKLDCSGGLAGAGALCVIARSRALPSLQPHVALIQNMAKEPRFDPQQGNAMFADGRASAPRIPGTLAEEDMQLHRETSTDPLAPHVVNGDQGITLTFKDEAQYDAVMLGQEMDANLSPHFVNRVPAPIEVTRDFL